MSETAQGGGKGQETDPVLHPKLRMFEGGDPYVNQLRSNVSPLVASPMPTASESSREMLEIASEFVQAQENVHTLNVDPSTFGKGRVKPKKKEADQKSHPPGEDSFVNVFVELKARDGAEGQDVMQEFDSLMQKTHTSKMVADGTMGVCRVQPRGRQLCMTVPVSQLSDLKKDPSVASVSPSEALKLDLPDAARSGTPAKRRVSRGNQKHQDGSNILIGIIDVGGFDFAHEDFLDANGQTRFLSIWDQGGNFRPPPVDFNYGSEFTRDQLNQAIDDAASVGFTATDLEKQSQRTPSSHGTHVASIAAGNRGVCPRADIVAVLIDVPLPEDQRERRHSTFSDTSRIVHAVEYLLAIARRENKPISINISLGTNGGPHDGSGGVSKWLDHALTVPGRSICVAAGNAGQEKGLNDEDFGWIVGRIHTSGRVEARGLVTEIEWAVVGDGIADISENELEIWYSPQDRFIVSVQPPGEDRWYVVEPGRYYQNKQLSDGTFLSIYNELYHRSNGANYISIYLSPKLDMDDPRGIRAGVWRVQIKGEEVKDGRFHAWIERDDPAEIGRVAGERFFRFPSFFSERSNVDSHSISSLGCGTNIISVGNLDSSGSRINITSSQGPTRDDRLKPDLCAPGTDIRAANGFAGDPGDKWVSMTGTSMASPYVTGVIGLMLAVNPDLNASQCLGILQRTSQPLPGCNFEWKNDAGFGLVDPGQAINEADTFYDLKKIE